MNENSHLKIAGLEIWIQGREFPDATDYWDGNWLRILARYKVDRSQIEVWGPIIRLDELTGFKKGLEACHSTLTGTAKLACIEPNLAIECVSRGNGHFEFITRITPDHLTEEHIFKASLDQSYFPPIIRQLDEILVKYPIKGAESAL